MDLNIAWLVLVWVLLIGYAILDGFDLGVGVLHLFARDDRQRRIHTNAVGPVWDGNEVWLLAGGGALFAAFPVVYATVLSSFYLVVLPLMAALICRAVSLEFRSVVDSPAWRRVWDWGFGAGSLVAALTLGVALGNILRGLPIAADGTVHLPLISLLNPYALLIGILGLVTFVMHGAAFLAMKTEGEMQKRLVQWTGRTWIAFVIVCLAASLATFLVSPFFFDGVARNPLFWVFLLLLLAAVIGMPLANRAGRLTWSFLASSVIVGSLIGLIAACLSPVLVPSNIDGANSLTAYNAASTARTLTIMLIVAALGMPAVIAYTVYVYRVFAGRVTVKEDGY